MNQKSFHFQENKHLLTFSETMENLLTDFFSINKKATRIRLTRLLFLLILFWFIFAFVFQQLPDLPGESFFYGILPVAHDPIFYFIDQLFSALFSINVFRYFIVFFSAVWFSSFVISRFMNQIHDMKNIKPTMNYLQAIAFNLSDGGILKIETDEISSQTAKSPLLKIGGPGKVMIGLENAAAFDQINGSVEIIGPTVNMSGSVYHLSGFEKLREIIDLRDHMMVMDITARSKDGIPIQVHEIRLIFSIVRGTSKVTLTRPYSFHAQAIWWLVYQIPGMPWKKIIEEKVRQLIIDKIREYSYDTLPFFRLNQVPAFQLSAEKILLKQKFGKMRLINNKIHPKHTLGQQYNIHNVAKNGIFRRHLKIIHPPLYFIVGQNQNIKQVESDSHKISIQDFFQDIKQSFSDQIQQKGVKLEWMDFGIWDSPINKQPKPPRNYRDILGEDSLRFNTSTVNSIRQLSRQDELIRLFHIIMAGQNEPSFIQNNSIDTEFLTNLKEFLKNYLRFTPGKSPEIIKKLENTLAFIDRFSK